MTEWTADLAGTFVIGAGTDYIVSRNVFTGLGIPDVRDQDLPRGDFDGDEAGFDSLPPRRLSFPVEIVEATPAAANQSLSALKAAWAAHRRSDTYLDLHLPGGPSSSGVLRFYGRPREVAVDLSELHAGHIEAKPAFHALDPYGYGPEETVSDSSSPAAVTSAGDVPTDRFTIEIVGDGGTPVITSTTDDDSTVSFAVPLAAAAVAVLDFRGHSVTVDGNDAYDQLAAGPRWFRLLPGANSITFTGCASVEIVHEPAYL